VAIRLSQLLHLHDSPRRTAFAFALGVFFSFSPFLGLQIVLAMSLAFLCGLNRLAVFIGLNANLPWIIAPWYAGTTLAAAKVMDFPLPGDFRRELSLLFSLGVFSRDFWTLAASVLRPLLVPFLVGPTIGAVLVGVSAYPTAYVMLRRRLRDEHG
jgi:uncharacterized protein (DUF2062 family)